MIGFVICKMAINIVRMKTLLATNTNINATIGSLKMMYFEISQAKDSSELN
jgi:hypothetical protein